MEKRILYQVIQHGEWCLIKSKAGDQSYVNYNSILSSISKTGSAASQNLIKSFRKDEILWKLAVGLDGSLIAIQMDNSVEIRSAENVFSTFSLEPDSDPSLRFVSWSPDGNLLVHCSSTGKIETFDIAGNRLYEIFSSREQIREAKIACLFSELRISSSNWITEAMFIGFSGDLQGFFLSHEGFQETCSYSFARYYPGGITAAAHHPTQPALFIAGIRSDCKRDKSSFAYGITSWRIIESDPYFKPLQNFENPGSIISFLSSKFFHPKISYDVVIQMSYSPEGRKIGLIHLSGAISVWNIPSLSFVNYWHLQDQPDYDALSPKMQTIPETKRNKLPLIKNPRKYHPVELSWWSEEHIIISRLSGSVTVCGVESLQNVLELPILFLDGPSHISHAYRKQGFIALECEVKNLIRKRTVSGDENGYQTFDEEPEEGENMLEKCKRIIYTLVTDKQPLEKTPTFVSNTFRLLHIKPTSPIEVFNEKLDSEEYGEALLLARRYDLDADLVFQRQWKNKEVSLVTIKDYLHKIKNTKWVLNECLTRPANDPDSARELLQYGLKLCDLESFVAIASGNDDYDYDDEEFEDPNLPHDAIVKQRQQRLEYRRKRLIDKVDIDHISDEQKWFLSKRKKLLQYSDRLFIYELVLGGFHRASELFDSKFYTSFRVKDPVAVAYDFASIGNYDALAQMFTYHGHETLSYRLCLLSCIPETTVPYSYRSLLPECSVKGEVFQWETSEIRSRDWSELGKFKIIAEQLPSAEDFAINDSYSKFINQDCNPVMISEWYIQRAKDIDEKTRLAGNAADLIRLGVERNIQGLEDIYNDLETLETLIYECQLDRYPGLKNLGAISEEDIARKIMAKSTPESFVNDLNYLLLPYLDRLERTHQNVSGNVLKDYLVSISEESLSLVALFYQSSAREDLIKTDKMLIRIAIDCIYACTSPSETNNALRIYESLPDRSDEDDDEMNRLQDELDLLHVVLQKVDILKVFDTTVTFGQLKLKSENYHESVKTLRNFSRQLITKKSSDENECRSILKVLLKLRQELLSKVLPDECCELIVESLLSQGRENLMHLAASLLEGTDVPLDPRYADLGCKIPVRKGQEIALKICLEFIDSASSFDDPALLQAQRCLQIFREPGDAIIHQLDFISALFILEEFGVQALPSKVRLTEDKIFYIKEAILACPMNYRKKKNLIKLGQMLVPKLMNEREIEGLVLNLIAETAVKANDNSFAIEICRTVVEKQFKTAWKVCWDLAKKSGITDLNQREDLLNFAITYCSDHLMGEIIQDKNNLRKEILKSRMQELCSNKLDLTFPPEILQLLKEESILTVDHGGHEESTSDYSLGNVRKNIFQVAASAKRIIDVVSKGGEGLGRNNENNSYNAVNVHTNNEFFCVPEFYEDAWNDSFKPSPSEIRLALVPFLRPENELLNFFRLLVNYLVLSNESLDRNVWCDLMQLEFEDNHLQFHAWMFYQTDLAQISNIFEKLKVTETGLFYLTYQLSFRILSGMQHFHASENLFRRSFKEVIQRALKIPKSKLETNELKQCHELLRESWKFLGDAIQGRQLKQLDPNVDTGRFAVDRQYKSDTIIGLAMTSDESIFKAALKLAERFSVDIWEVKYSYFAALFLDTNIPAGNLEMKLEKNEILQDLNERKEDLEERMEFSIYEALSGLDHGRLKLFYTLLLSSKNATRKEKAETFLKVLKKLNQHKGMDFKRLVSGKEGFLETTYPVLSPENVNNIAKLGATVSTTGITIPPSSIYGSLSKKAVLEGHSKPGRPAHSNAEWLNRFDESKEFMIRLNHVDFLDVFDSLCFSQRATETIPVQARCDFLNRGLKSVRQIIGRLAKEFKKEEVLLWEENKSQLECWLVHLSAYSSEDAESLRSDESVAYFIRCLESSKGDREAILSVQKEIAVSHSHPIKTLETISPFLPVDLIQVPEDLLVRAVKDILGKLRESSPHGSSIPLLNSQLKSRLREVKRVAEDSDLFLEENVKGSVEDFLRDKCIDLSIRLFTASVIPKEWKESEPVTLLLQLGDFREQLEKHWQNFDYNKINEETFGLEEIRYELLSDLCANSQSATQLRELLKMVSKWPNFTKAKYREPLSEPVVLIAAELARGKVVDREPVVMDIVGYLFDNDSPEEVVTKVFQEILQISRRLSLKLALHMSRVDLISELLSVCVLSGLDYDDDILDLIRRRELEHLFSGTVVETALKRTEAQNLSTEGPTLLSRFGKLGSIATGFWGSKKK